MTRFSELAFHVVQVLVISYNILYVKDKYGIIWRSLVIGRANRPDELDELKGIMLQVAQRTNLCWKKGQGPIFCWALPLNQSHARAGWLLLIRRNRSESVGVNPAGYCPCCFFHS
jgi:hypothetical protein